MPAVKNGPGSRRRKTTRPDRQRFALSCLLVVLALPATPHPVRAATANWGTPDLDVWFYPNGISSGTRAFAPTFAGELVVDGDTGRFVPLTAVGPARLGTSLVAFDTSGEVPTDLLIGRYQIHSAAVTLTMASGSGSALVYQDTPISQTEILDQISSGNVDLQRPMELYGVGLRSGYIGYEFAAAAPGPPLVDEITHPYSASDGGYIAYPIVGNGQQPGQYVDLSNNVTGGFSATEASGFTAPLDPIPWAIGTAGLSPGDAIPDNTTFTFDLDLTQPGARDYVRQSLAEGAVGFFFSSLHSTGEFGQGGGYPQWYMKESAGAVFNGIPATLAIDFDILDEVLAGDYDGNGAVEAADYQLWKLAYGGAVTAFSSADGNGNGWVDAADYTVWRNHLGETSLSGAEQPVSSPTVVPEPRTIVIVLCAVVVLGGCVRSRICAHVARGSRHGGFTLVELLVVIAIIGIMIAILLPVLQAAREAGRRVGCQSNLRQIGLAVQHYAEANRHLPPPKLGAGQFNALGGTFVALLPYLDESNRFAAYDPSKTVDDPINLPITGQPIDVYLCPSMDLPRAMPQSACGEGLAPGSYLISTRTEYAKFNALDGAFANPTADGQYTLGFQHVTDGASHTLLVGETNFGHRNWLWSGCPDLDGSPKWGDQTWAHGYWALAWGHMAARFPSVYNNSTGYAPPISNRAFRSDHVGGVQFAVLDGSVRFLADETSPQVRRALVTRAGGETEHVSD